MSSTEATIDDLNVRVSRAIRLAQDAEDDGDATAPALYAEVADLEAALADLHPADTVEGAEARRGAVRACRKAGHEERADAIANAFLRDPLLGDERREQIWAMLAEPDVSKL